MTHRQFRKVSIATLATMAILVFLTTGLTAAATTAGRDSYFGMGSGIGIPYGVIGVNFELNPYLPGAESIADYLGISGGVGYCYPGVGFAGGLHFYPIGRNTVVAPRLSAYIGTVGYIQNYWSDDLIYGGTLGGGITWKLNPKLHLELEVLLIGFIFGYDVSDLSNGRIKFAIGLQRRF
jgi:hypothetical protein